VGQPAIENRGIFMRKVIVPAVAAMTLSLMACQSKQADNVEDAAENRADVLEDMADHTANEAKADALENKADAVEEAGENMADAIDNGSVAANAM
jgi:hypothetical protein